MNATLRRAVVSGSIASVTSTLALAALGALRRRDPVGPLNGPSQWVYGRVARKRRGFSARHTLVGYAIHHATSVLWAVLFEHLRPSRGQAGAAAAAATTTALAYTVDYHVVPRRLQPGFEAHVPRTTFWLVYGAFALGLLAATRTAPSRGPARPGRR